jgi:hypothetical protein
MTDRDPAPPRPPDRGAAASGTGLGDRWWWSPTLAIAVGLLMVAYQLPVLRGPDPLWISWAVAAVGAVLALVGGVRLARASRDRPR